MSVTTFWSHEWFNEKVGTHWMCFGILDSFQWRNSRLYKPRGNFILLHQGTPSIYILPLISCSLWKSHRHIHIWGFCLTDEIFQGFRGSSSKEYGFVASTTLPSMEQFIFLQGRIQQTCLRSTGYRICGVVATTENPNCYDMGFGFNSRGSFLKPTGTFCDDSNPCLLLTITKGTNRDSNHTKMEMRLPAHQ